jgi:dihydroxyacetone kinase-like predicted kinase
MAGGEVVAVDAALTGAVCRLLAEVVDEHREIVTVIEGQGATGAATAAIKEWLAERDPGLELEVHEGGQPHHPYLISAE